MGRTFEIPRQKWVFYFDSLSKRALSHPIRIEVESRQMGDQEMARKLPLVGIELETKGSEAGDIEVAMGDERQAFLHHIDDPTRVYVKADDADNIDCIEIEDQGGGKTLIFFEGAPGVRAESQQGVSGGYEEPAPGP